ncbi:MAG TPA: hypothetical protein VFZ34_17490, partial [Blastocatellia bacterium]|nr:hypothetical protein [Blastocatellia bacterium]
APETLVAGQPTLLRFKLTAAETGQPLTDLQPYLGAWGHTVILSDDAVEYLHSHPLEDNDGKAKTPPDILYFETFFPRPGRYRIWSQFHRRQRVFTVSFDVQVI